MSKLLIVSASCNHEFAEIPAVFGVNLPDALIKRIIALSGAVKAAGAFAIEDLCNIGVWGEFNEDDDFLPNPGVSSIVPTNQRLQLHSLRVSDGRFYFCATTDACGIGDDVFIITRPIDIVELAISEPYVELD